MASSLHKTLYKRQLIANFSAVMLGVLLLGSMLHWFSYRYKIDQEKNDLYEISNNVLGFLSFEDGKLDVLQDSDMQEKAKQMIEQYDLNDVEQNRFAYVIDTSNSKIIWSASSFGEPSLLVDPDYYLYFDLNLDQERTFRPFFAQLKPRPPGNPERLAADSTLKQRYNQEYLVGVQNFFQDPYGHFQFVVGESIADIDKEMQDMRQKFITLLFFSAVLILIAQLVLTSSTMPKLISNIRKSNDEDTEYITKHFYQPFRNKQITVNITITLIGFIILGSMLHWFSYRYKIDQEKSDLTEIAYNILGFLSFEDGKFDILQDNQLQEKAKKMIEQYRLNDVEQNRFAYVVDTSTSEIIWSASAFGKPSDLVDRDYYLYFDLDQDQKASFKPFFAQLKPRTPKDLAKLESDPTLKQKYNHEYLLAAQNFFQDPYGHFQFVVGESIADIEKELQDMRQKFAILLFMSAVLVLLAQLALSYWVTSPIKKLINPEEPKIYVKKTTNKAPFFSSRLFSYLPSKNNQLNGGDIFYENSNDQYCPNHRQNSPTHLIDLDYSFSVKRENELESIIIREKEEGIAKAAKWLHNLHSEPKLRKEIEQKLWQYACIDWKEPGKSRICLPHKWEELQAETQQQLLAIGFGGKTHDLPLHWDKGTGLLLGILAGVSLGGFIGSVQALIPQKARIVIEQNEEAPRQPVQDFTDENLIVGTPKGEISIFDAPDNSILHLEWRKQPKQLARISIGGSELWLAGEAPRTSRPTVKDWPQLSIASLAAKPANLQARRLAAKLLDSGKIDQVLIGEDWREQQRILWEEQYWNKLSDVQLLYINDNDSSDLPNYGKHIAHFKTTPEEILKWMENPSLYEIEKSQYQIIKGKPHPIIGAQ